MNRSKPSRGTILLEMLIASMVSLLVGAGLLMMFRTSYLSRNTILGQNTTDMDSRNCLDMLSDRIRNAQMVSGYGAFSAASANYLTCYTDNTGTATACYWLNNATTPAALEQTVAGVDTVLISDVQSLQFTYYVVNGTNYAAAPAQWATTTNPNAPTTAEIPNVGAIGISVTVNNGGYTRVLKTLVRLRNSPARAH